MRVLVTGGSGIIGWHLVDEAVEAGHVVRYTYHDNAVDKDGATATRLDISERGPVRAVLSEFDPDVVIHTAALTDVDACERHPGRARQLNVTGTEHVASACEEAGCQLVLLSSSFVFAGEKDEYEEGDYRDPVNVYGETKVIAEDIVQNLSNSLIVRTDQPYTLARPWQTETMVDWVLSGLSTDGPLEVFDDWYNNPVLTHDFSAALIELIAAEATGVFHIAGPDFVSRYSWAKQIASAFGSDPDRISPSSARHADLPAQRPNANLVTRKVTRHTETPLRGTESGVRFLAASHEGDNYQV